MKIKVALLQMKGGLSNKEAYLEKASKYCKKAKVMGADIALFPEMWNIGYSSYHSETNDYSYDPKAPKHPELIKDWQALSDGLEDNYMAYFKALAKELEMAIGVTYLRTNKDGKPYNSITLVDRFANAVLTYDKVHTCDFSLEYHIEPGSEFKVVNLDTKEGLVTIGLMICYDREFPESARLLMLKGAEIILVPNACELEINRLSQLRSRAYENMTGIAVANYAGEGLGHSLAFDGMAFDDNGSRDMLIIEANEDEHIFMAEFDMDKLRDYRNREAWGNSFRKPKTYKELTKKEVLAPFIRKNARR